MTKIHQQSQFFNQLKLPKLKAKLRPKTWHTESPHNETKYIKPGGLWVLQNRELEHCRCIVLVVAVLDDFVTVSLPQQRSLAIPSIFRQLTLVQQPPQLKRGERRKVRPKEIRQIDDDDCTARIFSYLGFVGAIHSWIMEYFHLFWYWCGICFTLSSKGRLQGGTFNFKANITQIIYYNNCNATVSWAVTSNMRPYSRPFVPNPEHNSHQTQNKQKMIHFKVVLGPGRRNNRCVCVYIQWDGEKVTFFISSSCSWTSSSSSSMTTTLTKGGRRKRRRNTERCGQRKKKG